MKKIFALILLSIGFLQLNTAVAQNVDKQTFDEAIDYLNCRIAELSMADQRGRPHYKSFKDKMVLCDMTQFEGSFHTTLQAFLKSKRLVKSMQLAQLINALKTRYESSYNKDQLYRLVVDTLMKTPTLSSFKTKHQATFSVTETQINQQVYELFRVAESDIDFDDRKITEGEVTTFTDSNEIDGNYQNLDGGKNSNNELVTDSEQKKKKRNINDNVSLTQESFFDKYRWHILGLLLLASMGYYWFTRSGSTFKGIRNPANTTNTAQPKVVSGEMGGLLSQLEELKQSEIDLQEQITQLQFKVDRFELLLNNKGIDTSMIEDEPDEVVEDVVFDDVDEKAIDDNKITDEDIETSLISTIQMAKGASFFLSMPSTDGIFNGNQATEEFKRPYSIYLFTIISEDGKQAEFKVHEDIATMIRALDSFDEYLRPACRSGSILHKNATKIITSENGLAIQEDGDWKVVTKAVIHYT